MKQIMTGVFCILILSGVVFAQEVSCNVQLWTCPPDYPPDADVIVSGDSEAHLAPDIFTQDADWYFYDRAIGSWSTLSHMQVLPLVTGIFDDKFDQLSWEEYLMDPDTARAVTADRNRIYVMDEMDLHLIDVRLGFVLSLPVSNEWVGFCETLDGLSINWNDWVNAKGTHIFRCLYSFYFAKQRATLRLINDAEYIIAGALDVLDSTSPYDFENARASLYDHLRPPEIWFFESDEYVVGLEYYLKLDGTYEDDLDGKTLGPQEFIGMSLHERLVRIVDLRQRVYEDLAGQVERKRRARSAVVNLIDRILALTPGTWLVWIETGDDNILIRNLSNMYVQEER